MPKREYEWSFESPPIIKSHSLAKHRILKEYLRRYIKKLANNYMIPSIKLYIVDGFAGGGIYKRSDTNEIHWGSPVIIYDTLLETADKINQSRLFDLQFHLFFTEEDRNAFEILQKTLKYREIHSAPPTRIIESFNQSFENMVEKIRLELLSNSKNSRVIFILDQYGWSKISMFSLQRIFSTLPNAEVLLTFTSDWLIDYVQTAGDEAEGVLKTCIDMGILDKHYHIDQIMEFRNTPTWRSFSQAFFSERLKDSVNAKFYTPFFIKTEDSHRSYWLLHYSQHEIAMDEMTKVHWSEKNASYHPGGEGFNMLGYDSSIDYHNISHKQIGFDFKFSQSDRDLSINKMTTQLPEIIRRNNKTTLRKILQEYGNTTPGDSDMIRESLGELLIQHKTISAVGHKKGEQRQKGSSIHLDDVISIAKQGVLFLPPSAK